MGVSIATLDRLQHLKQRGRLEHLKAVCDIGAQQITIPATLPEPIRELRPFLEAFGAKPVPTDAQLREWVAAGYAADLWRACGVEYLAVDTSTEIPGLELDLNFDSVPAEHQGRFQLVLNLGTTEHVCNQLNAMKIIHDFCDVGGLMYHELPLGGHFNHGFFRYNPKFFWSLCRSNDYEYLDMSLQFAGIERVTMDIVESLARFGHDVTWAQHFAEFEGCVRVLLRKKTNAHFVPPFDGIVGNTRDGIPESYHSVFGPNDGKPNDAATGEPAKFEPMNSADSQPRA